MKALEEFAYLWDGSEPGWCLVRLGAARSGSPTDLAIYDRGAAHVLVIEDDAFYGRVVEHMLAEGCPVVTASVLNDGPGGAS